MWCVCVARVAVAFFRPRFCFCAMADHASCLAVLRAAPAVCALCSLVFVAPLSLPLCVMQCMAADGSWLWRCVCSYTE